MALVKLPHRVASHHFLSVGAVGWVYQINKHIVLKYPKDTDDTAFNQEVQVFHLLEKHDVCPNIVQSFLCVPNGIFLAYLSRGSLDQQLHTNRRHTGNGTEVFRIEPTPLVERWTMELCSAVSWLESLGYMHGDIRPPNLLLDAEDHLKLADFDSVASISKPYAGAAPPWARLLGSEAGSENSTFRMCGARTEQFAIGSIIYSMTRGYEPYEFETLTEGGPEIVKRLQKMVFPKLNGGDLDRIIERCWKGGFSTLCDLLEETKLLRGAIQLPRATKLSREDCDEIRKECVLLIEDGLLA